ncbi:MAG: hypothetical protein C5B57_13020 [Blastocatellia bacterium]|nr:MAG: hypothetical protein C5B57_13020 [Blastocatellia bacterium]
MTSAGFDLRPNAGPVSAALETLTKPLLFLSVLAAAWGATWSLSIVWPFTRWVVPAAFAVTYVGSRIAPNVTRSILLFTYYLMPGIGLVMLRFFPVPIAIWIIWIAALCGVMIATVSLRRWAVPAAWKLPLAFWALVVATTWPIVILREADFRWSRLDPYIVGWVSLTAVAMIVGILWLDSLFAKFQGDQLQEEVFEQQVLWPLAAGWLVAASVGLYQMFGNVFFLNPGFWGVQRRATGTVGDANAFGVISAMWGPVVFAIAIERLSGWRRTIAIGMLPLSWLMVWASGSRSALPIVAISVFIIVVWYVRSKEARHGLRLLAVAAVLSLVVLIGAVAAGRSGTIGPIERFVTEFSPQWSFAWVPRALASLESRHGYGTVASYLIHEFPYVGVGVGAFHLVWWTYAGNVLHIFIPVDNAQNWFRHQLAEVGVIGSLGWIVWVLWFLWLLVKARAKSDRPLTAGTVRGTLIGFGLISQLGIPAQNVAVSFTFWVLAFWFLTLLDPRSLTPLNKLVVNLPGWVATWIVILVYGVATALAGWTVLRPPVRAAAVNADYSYGFYKPVEGETFQWAAKNAVTVLPAPSDRRWLRVKIWTDRLNLVRQPVDAKVWTDRRLIVNTRLASVEPVTRYVKVPEGKQRVIVETWVSHARRPSETGLNDARELGIMVEWEFVAIPPANALVSD